MSIVTGDRYLESLVKFVEIQAGHLIEGTLILKLNPVGLHYVQSRLEALHELESLLAGAPVDYLRAYVSDLGDHRALEQLRRILRLLTCLKVVSVFPAPSRDPTPLSLLPFGRLRVLELRGCDLSTSAAKGLLELRHTLEKLICHNSTDALRHVFASRIAEIKDSPQWNRLSFVSCACNGLVLMDESLQLLPAVETLDLSRNKFAKVDNLRKCVKLKHLDLGFNHLRTISSITTEVSCHIVKLVLRNNALTSLHGIENLKSVEGLDLSFNTISNFSELEILASLSSLRCLWLEGNPLCCARWYRPQVFSYFPRPDKLELDDVKIRKREFWKRQIVIASRQKRPASFGFYSPAIEDAEGEGSVNARRRKVSRPALIANEEGSIYLSSDHESLACDNEIRSREENNVSDDDAEIVDLMNKVEFMKKERSILWLREFKDWMDHASENDMDSHKQTGNTVDLGKEYSPQNKISRKQPGESSRYVSDSFQASGDESSTIIMESDNSFLETANGFHETASKWSPRDNRMDSSNVIAPLTAIDDIIGSHSPSTYPGSPPQYKKDLLHRRQNLEEEILQLSAASYSVATSDSNSSCSEVGPFDYEQFALEVDQSLGVEFPGRSLEDNKKNEFPPLQKNGIYLLDSFAERASSTLKLLEAHSPPLCNDNVSYAAHDGENRGVANHEFDWLEKRKGKRKPKRRVVSLSEGNVNLDVSGDEEKVQGKENCDANGCQRFSEKLSMSEESTLDDDFIVNYFNSSVADAKVHETCREYMFCDCILEQESMHREREVVVVLSTERKLYVLPIDVTFGGSETICRPVGCHAVEDVREVLIGVGLKIVRVYIERDVAYMFITKSIKKAKQLLCLLQVFDSCGSSSNLCLRSLEQVQIEIFDKHICGGSKMSIFQYSMVLFWGNSSEGELWLSRSLFVIGGHLLVCIEDFMQFRFLAVDACSSPYFSLDSCCSVADISEMVIERRECRVSLALEYCKSDFSPSIAAPNIENRQSGSVKWKLKWFSEEDLFKFVALLKAFHAEASVSPLLVRCIS